MASKRLSAWTAGLSGGLLTLSGAVAVAQDSGDGIVRITDSQVRATEIQAGSASAPCQTGCPESYGGDCRNGRCGNGGSGHIRGVVSILSPHGAGLHSPDHGWAPPGRVQLPYRRPVAYQKWFPDPWTGQPVAYTEGGPRPPVVYMPTDTTQLGYYYQTVPRWHPNPNMVPPAPNPSQWHQNLCQLQAQNGYYGNNGVQYGAPVNAGPQPTPADPLPPGSNVQPVSPPPMQPGLEKSAQTPALVPVK